MDTIQIRDALVSDEACAGIFGAVCAADVFSETIWTLDPPRLFVVNTDTSDRLGTHWVAVLLAREEATFFDSYGLSPDFYPVIAETLRGYASRILHSDVRLQSPATEACGHYSIAFCLAAARRVPLQSFVRYWRERDDEDVMALVNEMLSAKA